MSDALEPMLMSDERADAYATYPRQNPARDHQRKVLYAVSGLAVVAVIVAVAAISVALSANSSSAATAASGTQLKTQVSGVGMAAMRAEKGEVSSAMLMNHPVCIQSRVGYMACLELLNTAQQLVGDLEDSSISRSTIIERVNAGDYNVGNAVAYSSHSDDTLSEIYPTLQSALDDKAIRLTVSDVADISKCDYVWRDVACLTVAEVARSAGCDSTAADAECKLTVVPIIHILDSPDIVHEGGKARREAGRVTVLFSIAGGIPDRRTIPADDGNRRRGIGGPCYSGLGERLLCHCNSSGCGYLEYKRDPSCRWGC